MDLHHFHYAACRSACLPSTVNIHLDAAAWSLSSQSQFFSLYLHFPLEWQVVPLYGWVYRNTPSQISSKTLGCPLQNASFEALAGERPTFWTSRQMHSTYPSSLSFWSPSLGFSASRILMLFRRTWQSTNWTDVLLFPLYTAMKWTFSL